MSYNLTGLRDYQVEHTLRLIESLKFTRAAFDGSDCGTGKTFAALAAYRAFIESEPVMVVGPKSAEMGWRDASKLMGVPIVFANYEKVRGARRDGKLASTDFVEEVKWGSGSFLKWRKSIKNFVFDEVHRCGGMTTLNSKTLIAARRQPLSRVLALSATAASDPTEMKALGFAMHLHTLNGPRGFQNWVLRYGVKPGYFGGLEFTKKPDEQDAVFRRLNALLYGKGSRRVGSRMRKAEIPGFPQTMIDVKLLMDDGGHAGRLTEELHALYLKRKAEEEDAEGMEEIIRLRQKLEIAKIPAVLDMVGDSLLNSKVVIFVNFRDTLDNLVTEIERSGWSVGWVDGSQVGSAGAEQRARFVRQFQANELDVLVCNGAAGSESFSAHDPTGRVERTSYIFPGVSGRQAEQQVGRVQREGGAFSNQYFVFFADTHEQVIADRMKQQRMNLSMLNDADYWL